MKKRETTKLLWVRHKFGERTRKNTFIIFYGALVAIFVMIVGILMPDDGILFFLSTALISVSMLWLGLFAVWFFVLSLTKEEIQKEQKQKAHDEALKAELVQAVREELAKEREDK